MIWASKLVKEQDYVVVSPPSPGQFAHVHLGDDLTLSGAPETLVEKLSEALTDCQAQLDGRAGDAD
jgi:hypothetical protein